jgi:hypothetical protein
MSVTGTWALTMQTPIGERKSTLTLSAAGATLTGTLAAEGNSTTIQDGKTDGNAVSWKAAIKNPMPLTLEFHGKVDGNSIAGNVSAGGVGSWSFMGSRA